MSVDAQIVHESPGRLRLRMCSCKGDSQAFNRIKGSLERCTNVRQLDINPLTGSVLIYHDADAHTIVEYGRTHDLFTLAPPAGRRGGPSRAASQMLGMLDSRLKQQTGNSWDLRELTFFMLSTGGLVQMVRRNVWPEALTLFWYAAALLQTTVSLRREENQKM